MRGCVLSQRSWCFWGERCPLRSVVCAHRHVGYYSGFWAVAMQKTGFHDRGSLPWPHGNLSAIGAGRKQFSVKVTVMVILVTVLVVRGWYRHRNVDMPTVAGVGRVGDVPRDFHVCSSYGATSHPKMAYKRSWEGLSGRCTGPPQLREFLQ